MADSAHLSKMAPWGLFTRLSNLYNMISTEQKPQIGTYAWRCIKIDWITLMIFNNVLATGKYNSYYYHWRNVKPTINYVNKYKVSIIIQANRNSLCYVLICHLSVINTSN